VGFRVGDLPARAVMGIVNVTPDSFSDGGRFARPETAIAHAHELAAAGAAVIDIGGESTRPGAAPVDERDELERVLPVVAAVAAESSACVSIDTAKAAVARVALEHGAQVVNDVTAGRDPEMFAVVAEHDAGLVLMHMRGEPRTMQDDPRYDDVVGEVASFLAGRAEAAVAAGVRRDAILVDPGIGFGKRASHNRTLLANVATLARIAGAPVLIGASRKRSLADLVGDSTEARDDATLAVTVLAFALGAAMVRVHDVAPSVAAARMLDTLEAAA
jgi:dihydropteroate synthase